MEKTQFDTLMLAVTGLNAKMDALDSSLDAKIDALDAKLDARFNELRIGIVDVKSELVVKINSQNADFDRRLKKLEGPNA